MDDDDDSSCESHHRKIKIGIMFFVLFLGYTISDTYFILLVVKRTGEDLLSLYNAFGALVSLVVSYGILKYTHKFETVNKKLAFGSALYISFEIVLYLFMRGILPVNFTLILFIIDNMALVAYSTPAETYAIKYLNDMSSIEVGAFENRVYIIAEIAGAGIAYSLYPNFVEIFSASICMKILIILFSLIYPQIENHDKFNLKKAIDFENLGQLVPLTAAEVYYLILPIIVASFWGERNFGIYEIIMETIVFVTIPIAAKLLEKNWKNVAIYLAMVPIILWKPLIGLLFYYTITSSIQLNLRHDVIEDQGVDDGLITTGVQKAMAAFFAFPVIYVFGATTVGLIVLILLSIGIFIANNLEELTKEKAIYEKIVNQ